MTALRVPSVDDFVALEHRVAELERRALNVAGDGWMPVAKSPLGARKTRRLIAGGKLAASRVGRQLFVRVDEVNGFLAARTVKPIRATRVEPVADAADAKGYAETHVHLLAAGGRGGERGLVNEGRR
jgi:hypothetical protein